MGIRHNKPYVNLLQVVGEDNTTYFRLELNSLVWGAEAEAGEIIPVSDIADGPFGRNNKFKFKAHVRNTEGRGSTSKWVQHSFPIGDASRLKLDEIEFFEILLVNDSGKNLGGTVVHQDDAITEELPVS